MFVTRLISGIILMMIALLGFIAGAPVLTAILLFISLVGYRELIKVLGVTKTEEKIKFSAPEMVGYVGITVYYLILLLFDLDVLSGNKMQVLLAVIVFSFLVEMFVYVLAFPKFHAEQIVAAVFAFLYAPVMLSFIDMTRMAENGKFLVWYILISSWGCDTCAYCVGMLIGKKKIFPVLSPKKSLEGCIGGVLGAALLGVIFGATVMKMGGVELALIAVICAFGAVASMVGDLAASAIKRNKEIKDYGKLIPGHGGIMDRFDSVIVTAPMVYFLVSLLLG